MSVLTAAVVLAWLCLAVLTMAMAGILRQLRQLQTQVTQLGTPPWRHAAGRRVPALAGESPLILLVLDPGCSMCDSVHGPFTELAARHPGTRFEVLAPRARWAATPQIRSRVDPDLVAELDLPWAPALLHADARGMVLAGQPVAAPERLGEQVAGLLDPTLHRQGVS